MNKTFEKTMALGMTAAMAVGMMAPAMAAAPKATPDEEDYKTTSKITIKGHGSEYKAYRLLTLTTSLKDHSVAGSGDPYDHCGNANGPHDINCYNYNYVINGKYLDLLKEVAAELDEANKIDTDKDSEYTEKEILAWLQGMDTDSGHEPDNDTARWTDDDVRKFAEAVHDKIAADAITYSADYTEEGDGEEAVFDAILQGYYLIEDSSSDIAEHQARSLVMLDTQAREDITINAKETVPTLTKKVMNDPANTSGDATYTGTHPAVDSGDWADVADADSHGDKLWFKLEGTMAEHFENQYETYKYVFHDKFTGLSLDPDSVEVYILKGTNSLTKVEAGEHTYEVKTSDTSDGCSFEVIFNDLLDGDATGMKGLGLTAADKIVVFYRATINDDAKQNADPDRNLNEAHIEFSNDPYDSAAGNPSTGETPKDYSTVFSFKVDVKKVDENQKALKGASFRLDRWDETTSAWVDTYYQTADGFTKDDTTTFTFHGLDVGKYRLVETDVPQGYAEADPMYFEVVATYKADDSDPEKQVIDTLKVMANSDDGLTAEGDYDTEISGETGKTFTIPAAKTTIETTIENVPGHRLPSTGGEGLYGIYAIGGLLAAAGVGAVVAKKRIAG